jgi:sulfotransferase family protein
MRPFFIVACDRSGSTMLRLILDRSPDVAIPTESMFLADMAAIRDRFGAIDTDESFDRLAATVWRHPKVREWRLGVAPPRREERSGDEAYRAALEAPFKAYAAQHGKPGWADKTPYYIRHIDEIRRVFPEARIVNLVRDGRDVALSLLRVPFGPANVWAAAHQWRAAIDAGDQAAERLEDDVLTIRYEDIVANPESAVPSICAFLGVAYAPGMLAIEETPPDRITAGQEGWFRELYAGIGAGSVGKWRREMTRSDIGLFESIAGEQLERHGYETGLGSEPPRTPAPVYLAQNWTVKAWHFTVLHVWRERGREVPYLVRRRLRR